MSDPTTTDTEPSTETCHCGHRVDAHDPIAVRYCGATLHNALSRGCICHPLPALAAGLFTRGRTPPGPPAPAPESS